VPSAVFVDRALAAADDDGRDASTDRRAVEPDLDVFAGGMASRTRWTIPRKVAICGTVLHFFQKIDPARRIVAGAPGRTRDNHLSMEYR